MTEREIAVYELDMEELLAELPAALGALGVEVEEIPAALWWFKAAQNREQIARQIGEAFSHLVAERLHQIEQP